MIKCRKPALEFDLLRWRQLHLVVVEAVPKLGNEHKAFIRRETCDLVTGEHRYRLPELTA
jgi:hypothetical protein